MTGPAHFYPDEGDVDWMQSSELHCRDIHISVFFPKGKDESRPRRVYDQALAICDGCPQRQPCLQYALKTNQQDGVWGGRTPDQRRRRLESRP